MGKMTLTVNVSVEYGEIVLDVIRDGIQILTISSDEGATGEDWLATGAALSVRSAIVPFITVDKPEKPED